MTHEEIEIAFAELLRKSKEIMTERLRVVEGELLSLAETKSRRDQLREGLEQAVIDLIDVREEYRKKNSAYQNHWVGGEKMRRSLTKKMTALTRETAEDFFSLKDRLDTYEDETSRLLAEVQETFGAIGARERAVDYLRNNLKTFSDDLDDVYARLENELVMLRSKI